MSKKLTKHQKRIEAGRAVKLFIKGTLEPQILKEIENLLKNEGIIDSEFTKDSNAIASKAILKYVK